MKRVLIKDVKNYKKDDIVKLFIQNCDLSYDDIIQKFIDSKYVSFRNDNGIRINNKLKIYTHIYNDYMQIYIRCQSYTLVMTSISKDEFNKYKRKFKLEGIFAE